MSQSRWISALYTHQFKFHHTEPEQVYLTRWLPDPNVDPGALPAFCQHFIGAGGCVVSVEHGKVLLITEKYAIKSSSKRRKQGKNGKGGKNGQNGQNESVEEQQDVALLPPWKIPGGQLDDPNESVSEAAMREVREETGVDTEFVAMLGFRHMHSFRFAKSDFYFGCLLRPKLNEDGSLPEPKPDPREIALCKWTDLDEYFSYTHLNRVQTEIQKAVKAYLEDPSVCLSQTDVTEHRKSALWFSVPPKKDSGNVKK